LKKIPHPRKEDFDLCSILYALSDPIRISIVKSILKSGECTCSSFDVPLAKSTMSHHFKVLREAGLIMTRVSGTENRLTIRKDEIDERFPGLIRAVMAASTSIDECIKKKS
jgi:DNA-binding transcriptional ArsR family regulator